MADQSFLHIGVDIAESLPVIPFASSPATVALTGVTINSSTDDDGGDSAYVVEAGLGWTPDIMM